MLTFSHPTPQTSMILNNNTTNHHGIRRQIRQRLSATSAPFGAQEHDSTARDGMA